MTRESECAPLALYVHMPWCVKKCPYCDFNSHQFKSARADDSYIDALLADFAVELPHVEHRTVDSVFFGGGTPSLFAPKDYARFLGAVRGRIDFAVDVEITLEANPGAVERGSFHGYRDAGINRISLGAQTFSKGALERLGRIHDPEDTHRAVAELRSAGIDNFNLDLMYALPSQTYEQAVQDVRIACALEPAHISYYQLTLEPGTVFHARPPPLPDDEEAWQMQNDAFVLLEASGYQQYEVSAYARDGRRCRHNLNYWRFGDYVGLGAGAHGKLTRKACAFKAPASILRTSKPKQPGEYQKKALLAREGIGERVNVDPAQLPFEFMLNALRLNEGFSSESFEHQTGLPVAVIEPTLSAARARGLIERTEIGWRPTDLGRRFLNDLQSAFLP